MSWLVGTKAIQKYLDGVCWRTVIRWKQIGLPILEHPGGRPVALSEELDLWIVKFNEKKKGDKRFKKIPLVR